MTALPNDYLLNTIYLTGFNCTSIGRLQKNIYAKPALPQTVLQGAPIPLRWQNKVGREAREREGGDKEQKEGEIKG